MYDFLNDEDQGRKNISEISVVTSIWQPGHRERKCCFVCERCHLKETQAVRGEITTSLTFFFVNTQELEIERNYHDHGDDGQVVEVPRMGQGPGGAYIHTHR